MNLDAPVSSLPGVGPSYSAKLQKLGISTIKDLLYHVPFRYDDFTKTKKIREVKVGETVSVKVSVDSIKNVFTKKGKLFQLAVVTDPTGSISAIWFNQSYLINTIRPGQEIFLSGKVSWWDKKPALVSPSYETFSQNDPIHTSRLVPVYHETAGVSSKWLRGRIFRLLETIGLIPDPLPPQLLSEEDYPDLPVALKNAHFPESYQTTQTARSRLAFEELFYLQLASIIRKQAMQKKVAAPLMLDEKDKQAFISSLPFELTVDQKSAISEILKDLSNKIPMNRILTGDVGSGKTVVAAAAAYAAFKNHRKALLMAPTQILAAQHYETLSTLFKTDFRVVLVTSNQKASGLNSNDWDLAIGTHALLHRRLEHTKDLGLIIIDEQHRFGVRQRSHFVSKNSPHLLTMTATPIPRTVAPTLYGDLDMSRIRSMPKGRKPVKTWLVPPHKRHNAYSWIEDEIVKNQSQCLIICPFIEPSESQATVKSATKEYDRLRKEIFPGLKLALLHGKMKPEEKNTVMEKMRAGEYQILVATPVVEVGIDLPRATVILIEDADKFGLAALHQLRGRVGRGDKQSYCLLFSSEVPERLRSLEKIQSGLELAELDLKLRGPGDVFGYSQHGFPFLKVADYSDLDTLKKAKSWAEKIKPDLNLYPALREVVESTKIPSVGLN